MSKNRAQQLEAMLASLDSITDSPTKDSHSVKNEKIDITANFSSFFSGDNGVTQAWSNGRLAGLNEAAEKTTSLEELNAELEGFTRKLEKKLSKYTKKAEEQTKEIISLTTEKNGLFENYAVAQGQVGALNEKLLSLEAALSKKNELTLSITSTNSSALENIKVIELQGEIEKLRSENATLNDIVADHTNAPNPPTPTAYQQQGSALTVLRQQVSQKNSELITLRTDNEKQQELTKTADENSRKLERALETERLKYQNLLQEHTMLVAEKNTTALRLEDAKEQNQSLSKQVEVTTEQTKEQEEFIDNKLEELSVTIQRITPIVIAFKTLAKALRTTPNGLLEHINSAMSPHEDDRKQSTTTPSAEKSEANEEVIAIKKRQEDMKKRLASYSSDDDSDHESYNHSERRQSFSESDNSERDSESSTDSRTTSSNIKGGSGTMHGKVTQTMAQSQRK